jgi:hypothetical protein
MPLDNETRELAKDLVKFMQQELGLKSIPKISFRFDHENAKKHLAMTGHFEESSDSIVVYAANRHPKDILRSLAHEMYHHYQKEKGELGGEKTKGTQNPNYIVHDDYLRKIEQDAFGFGNVIFRKWEASKKEDKNMKKLNESSMHEAEERPAPSPELMHKLAQKVYRFEIRGEDPRSDSEYNEFINRITDKYGDDVVMDIIEMGREMAAGDDWGAATDDMDYAQGMGKYDDSHRGREAPYGIGDEDEKAPTDPTAGHYKGPGLNLGGEDDDFDDHAAAKGERYDDWRREIEETKKVKINEAIKNSHTYVESDRAMSKAYQARDEKIYNELLRKFGIKKQ